MISVGGRAANFDVYIAHEQGESSFTGFGSFGGTVPSSRSHTYVYTVYTRFVPKNRIRVPNCNEIRGDAWFTRTTSTAHSATTNEASYRVARPFFRRIARDYRTIQKQPSSWISWPNERSLHESSMRVWWRHNYASIAGFSAKKARRPTDRAKSSRKAKLQSFARSREWTNRCFRRAIPRLLARSFW